MINRSLRQPVEHRRSGVLRQPEGVGVSVGDGEGDEHASHPAPAAELAGRLVHGGTGRHELPETGAEALDRPERRRIGEAPIRPARFDLLTGDVPPGDVAPDLDRPVAVGLRAEQARDDDLRDCGSRARGEHALNIRRQ
jgi:hypothetical protein